MAPREGRAPPDTAPKRKRPALAGTGAFENSGNNTEPLTPSRRRNQARRRSQRLLIATLEDAAGRISELAERLGETPCGDAISTCALTISGAQAHVSVIESDLLGALPVIQRAAEGSRP